MEIYEATEAFTSLSQETRLRVFRFLIEFGRDGTVPTAIAEELDIPQNTLSFHLAHMTKAGLVTSRRNGRSITYYANTDLVDKLIEFMRENCCAKQKSKMKSKSCNERRC